MLLEHKTAVIYGAGGAIGGAIAYKFANEGAKVFLAGRTLEKLDRVAKNISAAGGTAETAKVDALEAQSVEAHLADVVKKTGKVDISFNLIGLGGGQGSPLVETPEVEFTEPIFTAMRTYFLTATAAARQMTKQGSGVILALTAHPGRKPFPNTEGYGVAWASIEGICRQLAVELGPQGVRVVCLRSAGSPDAPGVVSAMKVLAEHEGISLEAFERRMAENTLLKRMPKMAEVANMAALMASDSANVITGAVINLTCGELVD